MDGWMGGLHEVSFDCSYGRVHVCGRGCRVGWGDGLDGVGRQTYSAFGRNYLDVRTLACLFVVSRDRYDIIS